MTSVGEMQQFSLRRFSGVPWLSWKHTADPSTVRGRFLMFRSSIVGVETLSQLRLEASSTFASMCQPAVHGNWEPQTHEFLLSMRPQQPSETNHPGFEQKPSETQFLLGLAIAGVVSCTILELKQLFDFRLTFKIQTPEKKTHVKTFLR